MKKIVTAVWLLVCLCGMVGCTQSGSSEPELDWAAQPLPDILQAWYDDYDRPSLPSNALAGAFFDYYSSYDGAYHHAYELRLLPEFAEGEEPDWEDVSHWLVYFAPYDIETEGYRAADMAEAAAVLLPDYEMPRKSSSWLDYKPDNDSFEPVGWDDHGAEFYVIKGISGDGEKYAVTFWVFEIDEMWFDELYASTSANDAALLGYAREHGAIEETENEITIKLDTAAAMRELLVEDKRHDNMVSRACVEVTFRLSGDEALPFTYLGCRRWPEDNVLEPRFVE